MTTEPIPSDSAYQLRATPQELKLLSRNRLIDRCFERGTRGIAILVLVLLGAILASLIVAAWPVLSQQGVAFITGHRWAANMNAFGALPAIYGTLVTSIIAIIIALPVSLGIAVFLTEICPAALRRPLGVMIELLAGIPSIIYGMWGMLVLAPILQAVWPSIFPAGSGLLTASIILAIMIIPFITATTRDVMATVPAVLRESAYGIGCTRWEVIKNIVFPSIRSGMVGGVILGLGRALGETMAVTFVIGNNLFFHFTITGQGTSIAALIASQFNEADGVQRSALLALGLVLFLITFIVLAIARYMLLRIERRTP
ncbi:Phosphate transport system permease protein PstC [Halomonadaceae bacterium LMG 33818]|uniref:phosphate ABC transporter permease subunit PstC n=1 Tax=Cernens ardua TaxID=3402176 RepID=UPI003EDBCD48